MSNGSSSSLPPLPTYTLRPITPLFPFISDLYLSILIPNAVYWVCSLTFYCFDEWSIFQQYRVHPAGEADKKNTVSQWECLRGVVTNQIIQACIGLALGKLNGPDSTGMEDYEIALWAVRIRAMLHSTLPSVLAIVGIDAIGVARKYASSKIFVNMEASLASLIYWYLYPAFQYSMAICMADTWQYFGHRLEHTIKWWYSMFSGFPPLLLLFQVTSDVRLLGTDGLKLSLERVHYVHHTLYVPYAFGAMYTHPLEGLFLDTLGTILVLTLTGMSTRQAMCYGSFFSLKAVSDHGGYVFPWDPMRWVSANDAAFHALHHERFGLKVRFALPLRYEVGQVILEKN
ncbi:MAG: hypothetical protein MMC33_000939 [Icmadophila ericetorum]|nr:hypothetical protein [Icmadophila ericetorum]